MNRISKRYEENKKPVEALRALYCVRCEDQVAPYFVNGTTFAFASYLCADGAYEDSIALTDYIWEKIKEKKRKGKAAISYYYLKYKNMKMLGLDGEEYLQKLYIELEANPKDELGKKVKTKIKELEENE